MRRFIVTFMERGDRSIGRGPAWSLSTALILALTAGCGGEPSRAPVSGIVNWQGQHLAQGRIEFSPTIGESLPVGGEIREGRYALPNPPGLAPGKYRVRIHSRGSSAAKGIEGPDFEIADPKLSEVLPRMYNDETTLLAEVVRGENTFNFDLTGTRAVPEIKKGRGQPRARVPR